jgi:hypothetical protein
VQRATTRHRLASSQRSYSRYDAAPVQQEGSPLRSLALLCIASIAIAALATNGKPPPTFPFAEGAGPYSWECDAPAGKYDQINIHSPEGEFRLTGSFRFVERRTHEKWASVATVALGGMGNDFALHAVVQRDTPNVVTFSTLQKGGNDAVFAKMRLNDKPTPFQLTRNGADAVIVSVGDVTKIVKIKPIEAAKIYLGCSTAHVEFSTVAIDQPKPD